MTNTTTTNNPIKITIIVIIIYYIPKVSTKASGKWISKMPNASPDTDVTINRVIISTIRED